MDRSRCSMCGIQYRGDKGQSGAASRYILDASDELIAGLEAHLKQDRIASPPLDLALRLARLPISYVSPSYG